jgi:hypothetical protein
MLYPGIRGRKKSTRDPSLMKIWFVVTIFGNIAATWGPLPYGMAECYNQLAEKSAEIDQAFVSDKLATDERMRIDGRQVMRADVVLNCVQSNDRPGGP